MVLAENVYYEFICRVCESELVTPIGFIASEGRIHFRVFSQRLRESIRKASRLLCLSPSNPLLFYRVVIEGSSPIESCNKIDTSMGHWLECKPTLIAELEEYEVYSCESPRLTQGSMPPYTRSYGCLVELLVLLTKIKAGILNKEALDYAKWLVWCVERSSPGTEYVHAARHVLNAISRALRES